MINYQGKLIRNLSSVLQPLNQLLQKDQESRWSPQYEEAFNNSKESLSFSHVLVHYNSSFPVILESDASRYRIGAVILHRLPNGDERPIAYASRSLNRPFPSSLVPLFQNESKCESIHMKMSSAFSFIFMQIKAIFMRIVSHLDSLWNRGTRKLGNSLFIWKELQSNIERMPGHHFWRDQVLHIPVWAQVHTWNWSQTLAKDLRTRLCQPSFGSCTSSALVSAPLFVPVRHWFKPSAKVASSDALSRLPM